LALFKESKTTVCYLQCSMNNQLAVTSSVRGFHVTASPQQKDNALTLCTQADGIRTITLNYAEKR